MLGSRAPSLQSGWTPRLWLLGGCCLCSMASMRVADAMLPSMAADLSTTPARAGQAISAFALAYGLLQLVHGPLGDRFGKLRVMAAALLLCAVANGLSAAAGSVDMLILCRVLAGAAAAGVVPLTLAWIGDTVPYGERQAVLARLLHATVLGMIGGQWGGGLLAETAGWRVAYGLLGVLFLLAGGLLWAGAGPAQPAAAEPLPSVRQRFAGVLASPWARRVLAVTAIEGALAFGALAFIPSHLQGRFGLSAAMAGAVAAAYGLGGLAYAWLAPALVQRAGEKGLAVVGGLAAALGFGTLAVAAHVAWWGPACLVAGFGFYALHNTLQTLATQMAPLARGTAVSLFVCALFLGQSAGVGAVASFAEGPWARWPFGIAAAGLAILGGGLALALRRRGRSAP